MRPELAHLHVHLEPGERTLDGTAIDRGRPGPVVAARDEFFARHSPSASADRRFAAAALLERMLRCFLLEQAADGVDYVELRVSPHRWERDGMDVTAFLRTVDRVLSSSTRPTARGILLVNRHAHPAQVDAVRDALEAEPFPSIVGLDLAGDELRHPDVSAFAPLFAWAAASGLGATVHAGEFGGPEHIWRALDELGARRIGHGLAASRSATLRDRLARDDVLLELSVTANRALGAVAPDTRHPAAMFADAGIPLCFNADIPLHTGTTLRAELAAAASELGVEPDAVHALQRSAYERAFTAATGAGPG